MSDILSILIELLREFDLPEPESPYALKHDNGQLRLLIAFPDHKIGICEGVDPKLALYGDWRVWQCSDETRARLVCSEIAQSLGIVPSVLRLDFTRVQALIHAGQLDAARGALDELQVPIQQDHPDWSACEKCRKDIRIAAKNNRPSVDPVPINAPKPSFPGLLKSDATRLRRPSTTDFTLVGLFSPSDETMCAVDAVWVAHVRADGIDLWAACLAGNPAYEADASWQTVGTEVELLDGLLARVKGQTTLVWSSRRVESLLLNWHYRAKGVPLPEEITLIDLQGLCQAAFPRAHRTDFPESLCKQLNVEFCDEMGNGGPLAAMVTLVGECADALRKLPDAQRAALRDVLAYKIPAHKPGEDLFTGQGPRKAGPILPQAWLDMLLPVSPIAGSEGYLDLLIEHFRGLPPPIKRSSGMRTAGGFETIDFLRKGGFVQKAAKFDYRERADQIGFSQRIEEAVSREMPYVLEAGTGIGKTVGYLVPALLSDKRSFVSTQTKALQDQAWSKDVPLVLEAFTLAKIERTVTIIKGKGNYVCLQTVADWLEAPEEVIRVPEDVLFFAALLNWLLVTETGWLSDIEHFGNWRLLHLLGRDEAPPKLQDRWADIDPHARAKDAAGKADLVLANHSYVFAHANASDPGKNEVETLILDEAHNVDDVVTEVLTKHFSPWSLKHELDSLLKRDSKGQAQGLYRALINHPQIKQYRLLQEFAARLETVETTLSVWCAAACDRLNDMLVNVQDMDPEFPLAFHAKEFWVESLYSSAKTLHESLAALSANVHQLLEDITSIKGLPRRIPGSLSSLEAHLNDNTAALEDLFEPRDDVVHWGEARTQLDAQGRPVRQDGKAFWRTELHTTPLDLAGWLRENLNPLYKHRVYLSATLTIGGDFGPICERLGLTTEKDAEKPVTGIYPSPFDYKKQALLAVPHDMPRPDPKLRVDPLYIEQQSKHIAELAKVSGGRMLVLFTSRLVMREMAPRLQARLSEEGVVVLSQTDANRSALIDRLREAPRKGEKIVLLGLRAFWEGVDVPGHALSVLVVSRLPFDYHGHPVSQAKQRYYEQTHHDADYFGERVVPQVFLHLRQMYGRLIRSETDRGCTIITDPRVYVQRYGRHLLQRLPETTTVIDKGPVVVDAVRRFLAGEEITSSFVWGELPITALDLSPEQRAIVECPSKRILVRAAAGSGKTHVLVTRLIRFVESGQAKPEEVLSLTFTNKAMEVMYDRIERALQGKAFAMHKNVLTYHKLAMRIIRQDDKEQGSETSFIDEKNPELQDALFTEAREVAGLTETMLNNEDARTMIGYAQNGLVNEADLEAKIPEWQKGDPLLAKFARFFLAYSLKLRQRNLIDYGEAIVRAVRILRENKEQAQKWSNRFKWVFCDEYQDTSPAQATILQLLAQQANLFVVGDNAQSIYSWQGSDPENLRRFEIDFPNTASFNLSKNYRCFPKLVRMSARFLEQTGQAHGISVEYDQKRSTEEQNVYFLQNEDDRTEATAVARLAREGLALQIPGDPPPKATVGILARKWQLLETIETELIRQAIPYRFEGETARGIVASQRVRDLVRKAADLVARASAGQEFGDTAEGRLVRKINEGVIRTAAELLTGVRESSPSEDLTGGDARDFTRLCRVLGNQQPSTLTRLFSTQEGDAHVVLSTVHSQKGEEFDTVMVIGLEEGNSPHEQPKAHERLLEWRKVVQALSHATWRGPLNNEDLQRLYEQEEKRIFYVAMTRAKYNLVVSRAKVRFLFGKNRHYDKSTFLALSQDPRLVRETANAADLYIAGPPARSAQPEGYRSDGRVYETAIGARVRSKSEMLLANEFTSRGIYFEYEEPAENVRDALPDFTFPDYGNVILEHLGMTTDPEYMARWDKKAVEYAAKGVRYLRTNEDEIQTLPATVDRLQDQFRIFAENRFGGERVALIQKVEGVRRNGALTIGRSIGEFASGVFEASDKGDPHIIAIAMNPGEQGSPPEVSIPSAFSFEWKRKVIGTMEVWVASVKS